MMKVLAACIVALAALFGVSSAEDISATPEQHSPPQFPVKCAQSPDIEPGAHLVYVTYDVSWRGLPENVRVRDSSNACFEDAAVAAIRQWTFQPRLVDGRAEAQTDLETTFKFILEEETQTDTIDARPLKRLPPKFPDRCQRQAAPEERVLVQFDVTKEGTTENISVIETTDSCFNRSAADSVERWSYRPKLEDGVPVTRKNVQTLIIYQFVSGRPDPKEKMRRKVVRDLNRAGKISQEDPDKALEMLAEIEAEYGASFTAAETAAFHQIRGVAYLIKGDANAALDDLRIARSRALSTKTRDTLSDMILQLEDYIAGNASGQPKGEPPGEHDEATSAPEE